MQVPAVPLQVARTGLPVQLFGHLRRLQSEPWKSSSHMQAGASATVVLHLPWPLQSLNPRQEAFHDHGQQLAHLLVGQLDARQLDEAHRRLHHLARLLPQQEAHGLDEVVRRTAPVGSS